MMTEFERLYQIIKECVDEPIKKEEFNNAVKKDEEIISIGKVIDTAFNDGLISINESIELGQMLVHKKDSLGIYDTMTIEEYEKWLLEEGEDPDED